MATTLPPLVGRTAEVQRLTAALTRAAKGQGGALFLIGEAGIGKTRLAQEALLVARARQFHVLHGRAYPVERGLGYAPILDAIGPFLRRLGPIRLSALAGGLPDLGRLLAGLHLPSPEPLGDPGLEKARLFDAVAQLLERLAHEAPLLLLLDDLHWADPASLELCHYLARGLADQRALLLATCRPPEFDVARRLRAMLHSLERTGLAEALAVPRLDEPAVALLAQSLLGNEAPAALLDLLRTRAAGTPLYVEALIRAFVDAGHLVRGDGGWELRADAASFLPAGVRELVLEQLDRLDETDRHVLDLIAVAGDAASHAVLRATSGLPDDALLGALGALRSAGLVAEVADPDVVYRVSHPLVQEVAYAELPEMARRRAHAVCAAALERLRPGDLERPARHYRDAGLEADRGRALAVLLSAGERAREVYANDEAARYFGAALTLVRAGLQSSAEDRAGDLPATLLERLGEAWERAGEVDTAVPVWMEALAEYERLGDVYPVARLRRRLFQAEWDRGHFDLALAHLAAGLTALDGRDPSPELADLRYAEIDVLIRRADTARATAAVAELGALAAHSGSPRAAAEARIAESTVYLAKGDRAAARERGLQALADAAAAGDPLLTYRAHDRLALVALAWGDHRQARLHGERGLEVARRLRAPPLEVAPHHRLVRADFMAGAWDEALRRAGEAATIARRAGQARSLAYVLSARALVLAYRGDLAEAAAAIAEAWDAGGEGAQVDRTVVGPLRLAETALALEQGQTARVQAIARRFKSSPADDPSAALPIGAVPTGLALLAELEVVAGDPESALATARRLSVFGGTAVSPAPPRVVPPSAHSAAPSERFLGVSPAPPRVGPSYPAALAAYAEGLAREALGEPAAALACLAQAGEAFAVLELPFESARAHLAWAALVARAGGVLPASAAAAAVESLAIFDQLGARRYAQRARQLCRQIGVRPLAARPARSTGGPLSARELEVARLAADGLTAPEIAARLFISQHTATTHLRRIYARLGVNSRAALARYVVEAGLLGAPH